MPRIEMALNTSDTEISKLPEGLTSSFDAHTLLGFLFGLFSSGNTQKVTDLVNLAQPLQQSTFLRYVSSGSL